MPTSPRSSSLAVAWRAPRPPKHCAATASRAGSCCSAAEDHLPYERPPLSKDYLAGKKALDDFTVDAADWYREHDVDLRLGTEVTGIDLASHSVGIRRWRPRGLRQAAAGNGFEFTTAADSRRRCRRRALPANGRRRIRSPRVTDRRRRARDRRSRLDRTRGRRERPCARRQRHGRGDRRAAAAGRTRPRGRRGVRRIAPRARGRPASEDVGGGDHHRRRAGHRPRTRRRHDGRCRCRAGRRRRQAQHRAGRAGGPADGGRRRAGRTRR